MGKLLARSALVLVALFAALFVAAGLFLSQHKVLDARHSAMPDEAFDFAGATFADYVAHATARLQAGRLDKPAPEIIANLAPFMLEPAASCPRAANGKHARGVLLIHGLIDSPYSMRPLGEYLRDQCIHVLGLLLPDHGTRPGDFTGSRWASWEQATRFATAQLADAADTVILSGHSAGGTLAILEAAHNPQVDALLLFAPALQISAAAQYAQYVALIGRVFPKAAWFEVKPDEALYRYESFPFTGAAETHALIEATMQALAAHARQLPVFTVASLQDNTVGTQAILDYMAGNTHPLSRTLLYSQQPVATDARTELVISHAPEQGILSVGHLGLMTPPSHPYYGRDGAYRNCGHYAVVDPLFARCKNGARAYYGEPTPENLQQGIVERIAFNPFYDAMVEEIGNFAAALSE